jgi:hypothetical protein
MAGGEAHRDALGRAALKVFIMFTTCDFAGTNSGNHILNTGFACGFKKSITIRLGTSNRNRHGVALAIIIECAFFNITFDHFDHL